ncbi:MAG TPA: DUF192 domain-containing protein [Rhodopila sp.]|jgi:hypothetical protein
MQRRYVLALATILPLAVMAQAPEPTKPQPELPKEKLVIVTHDGKQHVFNVEMALTEDQQTTGEMFRPKVPEDGGMLFDWGVARESQMWMENTLVPLDMVFINADGSIRSIAEDTTPRSLAVIDSRGPVRATLELAAGVTAKLDIRVGDTVKQRIFGNAP